MVKAMNREEKEQLERARRQSALKNTKFSRFLMIRYSLALFFFANLYWLLMQMLSRSLYLVLPVGLLFLLVLAIAEQTRLYGSDKIVLNMTEIFFKAQCLVQTLLVILLVLTRQQEKIFPIFLSTAFVKLLLIGVLVLGFVFAFVNIRRIHQIQRNKDRAYCRIQQLEKFV